MKYRWFFVILAMIAIMPAIASANTNPINENVWNPIILAGPLTVCTGNYLGAGTTSGSNQTNGLPPCTGLCDLAAQFVQILYYLMAVGIWIVIPVIFAWGAIKLMMSQGEPAKISEARKMMVGALVGVAIMLCAYLLVSAFVGFFGLQKIGGFTTNSICG